MTDPKRLLDDDTTELERLLLSAVSRERPSRSLTRRMRAGLGLAAGSLFTLKAAAAALSLAAVATGVAVVAQRARDTNEVPSPSTNAAVPARPASVPAPAPKNTAVPSPPEMPETPEALEPLPAPAEGPPPPTTKSRAAPALPDLSEQMRLLEGARAELRRGAPAAALAELDRYRKLYPRGAFAQEASVLRIDALRRAGQHAQAASLSRDFIRRYPHSPHVERLSQSLEAANSKP